MINRRRFVWQVMSDLIGSLGLKRGSTPDPLSHSELVGAWHLQSVGAPILHHVLCFHQDGIIASFQADGGFPSDSESDGGGVWKWSSRNEVKGAFLEFRYDRVSHNYLGFVRVDFQINMQIDRFQGQAVTRVYDASNTLLATVTPIWSAARITI